MDYIVAGLSIYTAPMDALESVSIASHNLIKQHERLVNFAGNGIIVSTCNRTEIYASAEPSFANEKKLVKFLQHLTSTNIKDESEETISSDISSYVYTLRGEDAKRHLFRVAAGLESLATGETQITGQISRSLQAASEAGATEPMLSRLFHAALRTSRKVHTETKIGRIPISVPAVGVRILMEKVGDSNNKKVLLLGAGETGRLAAHALRRSGVGSITVSSRRPYRALQFAEELGASHIAFQDRYISLLNADILVTCTSAKEPVILERELANVMSYRKDRPLTILDVGMPRDVAPGSTDIDNVTIITLAHIQETRFKGQFHNDRFIDTVEEMIEDGLHRFQELLPHARNAPIIKTLTTRSETIRIREMERALSRMKDLKDEQREIIDAMTRALVKKLLADPIEYIKNTSNDGAEDTIIHIFDLDSSK